MNPKLEQHHVKYEEIDGVDEIIMLTRSEHVKLHRELRINGAEPVPLWIIEAARRRSPGNKTTSAAYDQSKKGKAISENYRQSDLGKQTAARHEGYRQSIWFNESFGKFTTFQEQIRYNHATGSVNYSAHFRAVSGYELPIMECHDRPEQCISTIKRI